MTCLSISTATLAITGLIVAVTVLLIVSYLISVTRKARLGEAALDTYADSYDLAYEALARESTENARLDELLARGMREIQYRERRAAFNEESGT